MKRTKEGIPVVNRQELNLILDRIEEKYQEQFKNIVNPSWTDTQDDLDWNENGKHLIKKAKYTIAEYEAILKMDQQIKDNAKPKRGIVLMGKPGVGKTTILQKRFGNVESANDMIGYYMVNGIEAFLEKNGTLKRGYLIPDEYSRCTVDCIDDIGTEIIPSHYGNKMDLISFLIQALYNIDRIINYSTNLSYEELQERYGARVIDRLQEKCYFFVLEDTSFRKLATAESINKELK